MKPDALYSSAHFRRRRRRCENRLTATSTPINHRQQDLRSETQGHEIDLKKGKWEGNCVERGKGSKKNLNLEEEKERKVEDARWKETTEGEG